MQTRPTKREYMQDPARDMEEGVFNEAFIGKGGGIWAGTAFGLAYGGIAGALVGLVPPLLGYAEFSTAAIGGSAALCGGIGALTGRAAAAENGSSSGAVVGGTRIMLKELRGQMKALRKEILTLKNLSPQEREMAERAIEAEVPREGDAERSATQNKSGYGNWKSMLLAVSIGAVLGTVMWAASYLLAGGGNAAGEALKENLLGKNVLEKLGFGATVNSQLIGSALLGGAVAGTFGFNLPRFSSKIYTVARRCINGRVFEPEEVTEVSQQMALEEAKSYVHSSGLEENLAEIAEKRKAYGPMILAQRERITETLTPRIP